MNYKVMHRCGDGVWVVKDGFETLESARDYALKWYKNGDNQIEIYVKCRVGWRTVVSYSEPYSEALSRIADYFTDDCPVFE